MKRIQALAAAILVAVVAFGCGPRGSNESLKIYTIKGTVLLPNGKPARGARVRFLGKTSADADAVLASDGTFALKTMGGRDGAQPGKYQVVVDPNGVLPGVNAADQSHGRASIPKKYWSESSDLEYEVKGNDDKCVINLK